MAVEFVWIPPVENGHGFHSEDSQENWCMMHKATPEIAGLENNLSEENGCRFDSGERTVKLNNQYLTSEIIQLTPEWYLI